MSGRAIGEDCGSGSATPIDSLGYRGLLMWGPFPWQSPAAEGLPQGRNGEVRALYILNDT